ncbi:MAG: GFA family protein, partial [Rhodobacteraceae bacterium]|nr:GFA family protein [Paracoccaceae bacterium]
VRFVAPSAGDKVGVCHCETCRRWGGGPWMGVLAGPDVTFEGAENLVLHSASDWAERGFCRLCGGHLFFRVKANGRHSLGAGAFDDQSGFTFVRQICFDKKPDYYDFAQETATVDEATHQERLKAMRSPGSGA